MRISFEVDDTLILHDTPGPREVVVPWYWRWFYPEPLRHGTKALMHALQQRGCEICLYTTSYRQPRYLRSWFKTFGVQLGEIINQDVHDQRVKKAQFPDYMPSKFPPAFGIDLHVDDSEGVALEGDQHGFRVVVVPASDLGWAERVLAAVDELNAATGSR